VEKNSLERSHKGKRHIFSFDFLQILFDCFLRLRFAGKLIKEQVQPILDQYPMGVIDRIILKTIQFGRRAPKILGRFFCVNYF
jgi:hypothetical protein